MGLKVAVVGMSHTATQAPWDEPGWECWGLPWHEGYWRYMTRLFEMHDMRLLTSEHSKRPEGYMDRLKECQPYMQEDSEYGRRYPFEEVAKTTGYYWNSSIGYALAMAIHEGAEEIGLYGVDMKADDEYGYQRPNVEFLVGLAMGKGIKVHIPEESPVLKFSPKGPKFFEHTPHYVKRYGWLG